MDDLSGLDWSASSKIPKTVPTSSGNYYPVLRPTPPPQVSGRNTPLSAQGSGYSNSGTKPHTAGKTATTDSFSNLVSFGSSKQTTLTLQQQQEKLQAEKQRQEAEKRKQYEAQFGNNQFWDGIGNKGGSAFTPLAESSSSTPTSKASHVKLTSLAAPNGARASKSDADDDLFAAFNVDTKVDASSYYPPPSLHNSGRSTPAVVVKSPDLSQPQAWDQPGSVIQTSFLEDDDPFGLSQLKSQASTFLPQSNVDNDDDFLGDLGRPVEEVRRANPSPPELVPAKDLDLSSDDPWDKAVRELTDMGFSAEQSQRALTESGAGLDVQAAVGWILNNAHRQAKLKQQGNIIVRNDELTSSGDRRSLSRDTSGRGTSPAWMREDRESSRPGSQDRHGKGEADITKTAAAVGSNLIKTANTFWKQSQKKVQKAVAEFQQDTDPSQPKWMREVAEREQDKKQGGREKPTEVTDEARMLDGGGRPPPRKHKSDLKTTSPVASLALDQGPVISKATHDSILPRWQQTDIKEPRSRISKQAIDEQSAQAYISPARRKKATPQPTQAASIKDLDLSSSTATYRPTPQSNPTQRSSPVPPKTSSPIQPRPKAAARQIPPLSAVALQASTQHRLTGTTHFKRGDYASAHLSYSSSIATLPPSHPITIILLCNHALTSLKTGVPKEAVADADTALGIIGAAHGEGETIDLGPGEGGGIKEMKEYWGKALTRKAEALEQMERWTDALEVWKRCVEGGVGGSTAIQGRGRCEKALTPGAPPSRTNTPKIVQRPKPKSAMADLGGDDSAAVKRLREANEKAGKEDDEKFALSDKVDAKIGQWRDGKRDNLRALIGSLDTVMWEGSGWKKVGMHELVQNNKVKINYMKAIGKCHPDKLPQDATTEVRMIAALVFATLNESWDKFKQQNGL